MDASMALSLLIRHAGVFVVLVIIAMVAWNVWLSYIQTAFLRSNKWVLLEIKPPKEVHKSPLAMELVLNALYAGAQSGEYVARYWKGEVSLWSSLEIVSIEGKVRFYVWIPEKWKKTFSTQLYAQYPQAEVTEVEDYTKSVPDYGKDSSINVWGSTMKLTKDDPFPIKTYVDYGLDRAVGTLDEEQRIDPLTPLIEFLGSLGITEQAWMQILIRPDTKRFTVKGKEGIPEESKSWTDKAKEIIKEQNAKLIEKDAEGKSSARRATKAEAAVIESIERNAQKYAFDTMIRLVYLADKDKFNSANGGAFTGAFRQFNNPDSNGFKGDKGVSAGPAWKDFFGNTTVSLKRSMLGAYKKRGFFYGKFDFSEFSSYFTHPNKSGGTPFILSTEELATLYHLPGRVAETPTVTRIESKKGEPPANLPI